MKNPKCHVLIPDGNSTWALTVINCLSQNEDYKLFVLSNKKRTAVKFSNHISYFKYYERTSDQAWLEILTKEVQRHNISILIPIAEAEIGFLIRQRAYLSNFVNVIPIPEIENFETAIDKHKLAWFLKRHNLPYPKFKYFDNSDCLVQEKSMDLNFPVIIKPLHEKGGDGIIKFKDQQDLDLFISKYSDLGPLFFQEYIEGYDIDCSVLSLNGKILTHTIQRGKLEGDNAFAPQLCFDFLKNEEVLKVVSQLMQALNWSGVAHVDLRYDSNSNEYKVIEVNARFWGSVEGSRFAGINFPDLAIQLALNNQIKKQNYEEIEYMRLKGVLKSIKRKPSFLFNINYLLNNSEVKSFLKDPTPTLYRFVKWSERQF